MIFEAYTRVLLANVESALYEHGVDKKSSKYKKKLLPLGSCRESLGVFDTVKAAKETPSVLFYPVDQYQDEQGAFHSFHVVMKVKHTVNFLDIKTLAEHVLEYTYFRQVLKTARLSTS